MKWRNELSFQWKQEFESAKVTSRSTDVFSHCVACNRRDYDFIYFFFLIIIIIIIIIVLLYQSKWKIIKILIFNSKGRK